MMQFLWPTDISDSKPYSLLKDQLLKDFTNLEKFLVCLNVLLFAASFQCQEVDSEVSTALIYIMFAIAYFVTTTTCLNGAATIKKMFTRDQNENDEES